MYRQNLKTVDMSVLAPQPTYTSVYQNSGQNGGLNCGGEMEPAPVIPTQRRYTLHDGFYDVLVEVGAKKDQPYEWKDVIMLFIRYLAKRKPSLLDPNNKSRVICGEDPLGRVFGVPFFTKEQTKLLVRQHVSLVEDEQLYASLPPLPPITGPCPPPGIEPIKRGSADESAEDPDSKRSRSEPSVAVAAAAGVGPGPSGSPASAASPPSVAAAPSPAAQLRRTDTIEMADGGVTVSGGAPVTAAYEHEDEVASCDEADDHRKTYAREMEPVECTDASDSDCSSGGVSDVDSPLQLTMLSAWADDVGMMADMETSESESEHRDTWLCSAADCQHANSARKSRCDRCWRMRPSWVIGPRRKKRRHRDQARQNSLLSRSSAGTPQGDGSLGSQGTGGSQETCSAPSPSPPAEICLICCERPRDAAIIHGRTGCQVTCYGCARKLWKRKDLCPSCRRTIEKIVFMRFG